MKHFFLLYQRLRISTYFSITALFFLINTSYKLQAQLRIGDPGITFNKDKFDSRYPQMQEWQKAGVRGGIPFLKDIQIVKTINSGANSNAINKAINEASTQNGLVAVFLRNGNYKIDKTIRMKSNVSLIGESRDGVKCVIQMNSGDAFRFYKIRNSGIYTLTIKGNWGQPKYDWNYSLNANDELPRNNNISVKFNSSTDCWLDKVNIFNCAKDPVRVPSNHITLRDLKVDGAHKKSGGAQGYFFIQGAYNLITGCEVTHLRHISLQGSKVEYNVVYNNDFKQEVSFHSGDKGNNLIENNRITLPKDMPNSKADTPNASYNNRNEPNYYAIMGAWSSKHQNSKNPNFIYKNECLEKNHNNLRPWSNPDFLYKGPKQVKPRDPATNFPALPRNETPTGGTLYPVILEKTQVPVEPETSEKIKNGTYYITSPVSNQRLIAKELDLHSARMVNPQNYNVQKWIFTHLKDNIYNIRNKTTNRYLEVPYAKCSNGEDVATWISGAYNHQKWKVIKNGNSFSFKPIHCQELALDRSKGTLNTNAQIWKYNPDNKNQKWKIINTNQITNSKILDPNVQNEDLNLKVFPNPSKNNISIRGINYGDKIKLYRLSGELINTKIAKSKEENINISYLKSGAYIVSIPGKGEIKFIKK